MIRSNPAANMLREIKMAHGSEIEKRKALTLEQEELFLGYLARTSKYQHWYPVFYIMANTGMRVGEITGLRWCDVDMENGIISVNHTLVYYNHRDEKGCYFSINTPKTKSRYSGNSHDRRCEAGISNGKGVPRGVRNEKCQPH